ncbi:hypothetical_protein (plasmid) [Leishmania braziliensis MHOM/BR/75/M2904]|uniref:Hypothetical_protein n=1 Tax=Leishmania braziliensis MHOM/BR/75/M2904 TaxID=420245 RepID=A0A3P3Z279_LEIBR|nr:unnamed protein product [Leishmania braziliensis]SYZ64303.1 hypothetical_protein [Leishmania braziliensis MHOM/BR/75/M2904]
MHQQPVLNFCFADSGTGVFLQTHGTAVAEVLYDFKYLWLSEPTAELRYDAEDNTLGGLRRARPAYTLAEVANLHEYVCTRGGVIYIHTQWYAVALNIDEALFMPVSR